MPSHAAPLSSDRRERTRVPRAAVVALPSLALAVALALAGCGRDDAAAGAGKPAGPGAAGKAAGPGAAGPGAMPPMPVGVVTVRAGAAPLAAELPGRLEAWRQAQVRARVAGIVQKRVFTEGALVAAGQPLYVLDAEAFQATLAQAQAQAARAEADVALARAQVERQRPLAEARAIAAQEFLATQTALRQAEAAQAAAKAAIASARVPLKQATVTAPIGGRIGRSNVSEGALVGPTDPTPLALIQQTHPLYVNFTQPVAEVMRLKRAIAAGQVKRLADGTAAVNVVLDDGTAYPRTGRLLFVDPTVDAATGQMTLRAEVPNPDGALLPGLFVRVRLVQAVADAAVRVPQQALMRGAGGDSVFVLDAQNRPQPRKVTVGAADGAQWIVLDGLAAGDRVVVDGFQKMRPGAPVTPVPWTPPGAGASAPGMAPAPATSAPASAAPAGARG